jgi:hypothetical protein
MLFNESSPLANNAVALTISAADCQVLRELAARVAELAVRPIEGDKRRLWLDHNALRPTRPLIFCDPENGWNEIVGAVDLRCEGALARMWEMRLRKEVFWGAELQDDRVIEPFFDVAHVFTCSGWGMESTQVGGHTGGAYTWDSPIRTEEDARRLRFPEIDVDDTATQRILALAQAVFDGLLTVRLVTRWWWSLGLTWNLASLRGLQQLMYDMVDRPEFVHQLMAFLRDGAIQTVDSLEQRGLLAANSDGAYVGSGGFGWSDELPAPGANAAPVRLADLWGFAESQETVGISPAMFEEFVFPYQLPLLERFGLNCYGCCEPLDTRWHVVQRVPRLRRVSVSPWANRAFMAEMLQDHFIYSMKPHPGDLAMPSFDEERIRCKLREDLHTTRHCRVEVIMKDNHTIGGDPRRVLRWVKIAREEAERLS